MPLNCPKTEVLNYFVFEFTLLILHDIMQKKRRSSCMKKIIAILLCSFISMNVSSGMVFAIEEAGTVNVEHIALPKKLAKKAPTNIVNAFQDKTEILSYNTLQVAFAESFDSQYAKVGDRVVFILPEPLKTEEGTEILPASTKIVSEISNIERPKSFNRNGKVHLDFKYLEFPNGSQQEVKARLFNKNNFLSRGKLGALGKGLGTTLGGMAVGTGAGCGIGIAASSVLVGGLAIGMPVGFAAGSVGLFTPGLNYKANVGDKVDIQLLENVVVQK